MTFTTEQIREMLGKTTPGNWQSDYAYNLVTDCNPSCGYTFDKVVCRTKQENGDAAFIAASKTIVEQLLRERECYRELAMEYWKEYHGKHGGTSIFIGIDAEAKKLLEENSK